MKDFTTIAFLRTKEIAEARVLKEQQSSMEGVVSRELKIEPLNGIFLVKCRIIYTEEYQNKLNELFKT